jgi:hypothetical protein
MHLHENANRHVRENARCNAAMQISADLRLNHHSGARALRKIDEVNFVAERANPESRTVHGAGFRVCAQEGASRNDEF